MDAGSMSASASVCYPSAYAARIAADKATDIDSADTLSDAKPSLHAAIQGAVDAATQSALDAMVFSATHLATYHVVDRIDDVLLDAARDA